MKKLSLYFTFIAVMTVCAQNTGLGFNYQAVVRNTEGILLSDTLVNLRVSLWPGEYAEMPTWVETHEVQTDIAGSLEICVGEGKRDAISLVEQFSDVAIVNFIIKY